MPAPVEMDSVLPSAGRHVKLEPSVIGCRVCAAEGTIVPNEPCVGIVANPASARDIRRLVADASAHTAHDKVNILKRVMAGLGRAGIDRAISMTDRSGVSAGLARASTMGSARGWPALEFVDWQPTGTSRDTVDATRFMLERGAGAIVVLGGDGTHQLVAEFCGATPLVGISTGTNNAFPAAVEPTVAGLAAGLVAAGAVSVDAAADQAKYLLVEHGDRRYTALVDVAVIRVDRIGSGAVWQPEAIDELYLTFARADAIGLSSIGGHVQPVGRYEPMGLALRFGSAEPTGSAPDQRDRSGDRLRVTVPIGPGRLADLTVASCTKLAPDRPTTVLADHGVVAIDGERRFRFGPADGADLTITLRTDGPFLIDVAATLDQAARAGLLISPDR